MRDVLTRMLETRDWLLADGATGTALVNSGAATGPDGAAVDLLTLTRPDAVRQLVQGAVTAGCDIVLTNSFGANASRLGLAGAADRVAEVNEAAAALARDVADRSGRAVLVAGSIGPTGEIPAPMGALTTSRAVEMFHQQAEALRAGGADLIWAETFASLEELRAAGEAARLVGLPWVATMSFDMAGRTVMGVTPARMAAQLESLAHPPVALGANCGVGASDNLRAITGFAASGCETPLVSKGNAGIPHAHHGRIDYDGTPELMADYAVMARDLGCRIIGGCCGTSASHLRAMREALETTPPQPRPTLEAIAARLGSFTG